MLFIYIWLAGVTTLLLIFTYHTYTDSKDIQHMHDLFDEMVKEHASLSRTHHQNLRDLQHQHDHLQRLESDIQDVKARFRPQKKPKKANN